jgi:hypothetical protein
MTMMRAVVLTEPGPVSNLQIRELPVLEARPGWVRIAVKAFGLNRSELHLRLGLTEGVRFPIVPGIEAVGTVDAAPGTDLRPGQQGTALRSVNDRDLAVYVKAEQAPDETPTERSHAGHGQRVVSEPGCRRPGSRSNASNTSTASHRNQVTPPHLPGGKSGDGSPGTCSNYSGRADTPDK